MPKIISWILLLGAVGVSFPAHGRADDSGMIRLKNHVPQSKIATSRHLDRMPGSLRMSLAVTLLPRNSRALEQLVAKLYDPTDPLHGKFLTPEQFTASYAPSVEDYNQILGYFASRGLNIVKTHPNRLVIDLEGAVSDIESGLQTEIHRYKTSDGRIVHAPVLDPMVSESMASRVSGIAGLDNFRVRQPHFKEGPAVSRANLGTGPLGALAPQDIKLAYGLNGAGVSGAGQSVALFELDGYATSDITPYRTQFSIATAPTLTNVLVDGASGVPSVAPTGQTASGGQMEVTLDIDMVLAVSPAVTTIYVYEGPNTDPGAIDTYAKIANDNLAKQVSSSWGSPEDFTVSATMTAENTIFLQMATQGQSFYAAAGDSGAYGDQSTVVALDPCTQPYAVCVGGTQLTLGSGGAYLSETTWSDSFYMEGGGGGISTVWTSPSWQTGLSTTANHGSAGMRMTPDVSLDADPATGYAVYVGGGWTVIGGTSAAAPLWAGFTALVNQTRSLASLSSLGFPNPSIYQIARSALYSTTFHDIADLSTNLYYPAVQGYDLATGWGSFNGVPLLQALSNPVLPPSAPVSVQIVKVTP